MKEHAQSIACFRTVNKVQLNNFILSTSFEAPRAFISLPCITAHLPASSLPSVPFSSCIVLQADPIAQVPVLPSPDRQHLRPLSVLYGAAQPINRGITAYSASQHGIIALSQPVSGVRAPNYLFHSAALIHRRRIIHCDGSILLEHGHYNLPFALIIKKHQLSLTVWLD